MHIAIEGHGGANLVVALHAADRYGDVVDHAEALAVVGEGVVESAADAYAHFVYEAMARGEDRSTGSQPEGVHQLRRERNLQLLRFTRTKRSSLQFLHILWRMDQQNVEVGRGLGFEKVAHVGDAGGEKTVANAAIFFGRKDVSTDGEIVGVAIDELEGQHDEANHHTPIIVILRSAQDDKAWG